MYETLRSCKAALLDKKCEASSSQIYPFPYRIIISNCNICFNPCFKNDFIRFLPFVAQIEYLQLDTQHVITTSAPQRVKSELVCSFEEVFPPDNRNNQSGNEML